MTSNKQPEFVEIEGKKIKLNELLQNYKTLQKEHESLRKESRKALKKYRQFQELKPYEAELIKMQEQLEKDNKRMIILFEGRDAAGKGGAIRRVTHYMNEKHYRVVALGRPSEVQRSQWFFQKYVTQFPRGGEIVLFDRSWYNRAGVERVMKFCTKDEYKQFLEKSPIFQRWMVE